MWDLKRYLRVTTLSKDGLLVVRWHAPLAASVDCIVVPRSVLDGLLTALHVTLDHPTYTQLKSVGQRYFYAMDSAVQRVTNSCHQCAALKKAPVSMRDQTTGDPPEVVGSSFSGANASLFLLSVNASHHSPCSPSSTLNATRLSERPCSACGVVSS